MDAITAAALTTALKNALDMLKSGKYSDAEREVLEIRRQVFAVIEESDNVRRENAELKRQLELKGAARRSNGVVHFGDDPQPYCDTCYSRGKGLTPLIDKPYNADYICGGCDTKPPKPGYVAGEAAYPVQPGDNILKGGHVVEEYPLDWPGPNQDE